MIEFDIFEQDNGLLDGKSEADILREELENTKTALRDVKRDLLAIVSQTIDKTWPRSLLETNKALKRDVESFMYELQERIKNL